MIAKIPSLSRFLAFSIFVVTMCATLIAAHAATCPAPVGVSITDITPPLAKPGDNITITGTGFVAGTTRVSFDAILVAPAQTSATTLSVTIPTSVTPYSTVAVAVVAAGVTSAAVNYTLGPPVGNCTALYCSIEGDAIPDPSKNLPGIPAPFRAEKINGAGPYMNAYAIDKVATRCTNGTPAVTRLWWHNIDFAKYQSSGAPELPYLAPNEAMTWKFVAPQSGSNFLTYDRGGGDLFYVPAFMSVSQSPCDFDVTKVPGDVCYKSGSTIQLYWVATNGAAQGYECKLIPGQTYFINLRLQDARPASQGGQPTRDACAIAGRSLCGGAVQLR